MINTQRLYEKDVLHSSGLFFGTPPTRGSSSAAYSTAGLVTSSAGNLVPCKSAGHSSVLDFLEGFRCFAGGNPWDNDVREIPLLARYESEM